MLPISPPLIRISPAEKVKKRTSSIKTLRCASARKENGSFDYALIKRILALSGGKIETFQAFIKDSWVLDSRRTYEEVEEYELFGHFRTSRLILDPKSKIQDLKSNIP